MSYDTRRKDYAREHIDIIELELDFCDLTFGVSPCVGGVRSIMTTAVSVDDFNVGDEIQGVTSLAKADILSISGSAPTYTFEYRSTNGLDFLSTAETINNNTASGSATKNGAPPTLITVGDGKCYNTFGSCQDTQNFTNTTGKIYRLCNKRSPHPIGIDASPFLTSVSISPAKIDPGGGLGIRSSVSAMFSDHPSSDIDIDPYLSERTYNPLDRGLFFTKLRARNPGYQFRAIRHLSGYLVNGVYDVANFQTRHYVINFFTATQGTARIEGKDPLKLATGKKALVPEVNTGKLDANITVPTTAITLTPAGVGNDEYATSGEAMIGTEIVTFTRVADDFTIVRAQRNTTATAHSLDDVFQQSYVKNAQVNVIVEELLTTFANIDPAFINSSQWQAEIDTYLSGLLDGTITKPMDVNKALKELSDDAPHYLYWDERTQLIVLTALKAPPDNADVLNMDDHLLSNETVVGEAIDERISTVTVNYGQIDPTKKIDEPGNFTQSYIRVDTDSVQKFGSNKFKTINSRWINNANKAQAVQLATQVGRRFSNIPRTIEFSLDPKDSQLWVGENREINHRDIVDFSGLPENTIFQILSVRERRNFNYTGLEFNFGEELPGDESGIDEDLVIISTDQKDLNLRTLYDTLFPTPDGTTVAKFIVESGKVVGSTSTSTPGMRTGTWPVGAVITLQNKGFTVGMGGKGSGDVSGVATDGGDALLLEFDLTLDNLGVIGSGGGGGGRETTSGGGGVAEASGGGGAGCNGGEIGTLTSLTGGTLDTLIAPAVGDLETGGAGGFVLYNTGGEPLLAEGGVGGSLGASGETKDDAGGGAGNAIDKNGFVLTQTTSGDIRGAIVG